MKTIFEPFRIKMTEPLKSTTKEIRIARLEEAHFNVFLLDAEDCMIDLLTDSGTGAMSAQQWAALMLGDESYAGSRSWKRFEETVHDITRMKHIFPTHQGRAAERLLALTWVQAGQLIPNNNHFDTTRANLEFANASAIDLPCEESAKLDDDFPFKGNIHLGKLKRLLEDCHSNIPFAMITVTNNAGGGQPVSMTNIREAKKLLRGYEVPLIIDACRFAENAYFIQRNEEGYRDYSLIDIAREMFSYADAATMSLKKDGLANIGGFFVCRDDAWAEDFRNALILQEGFPTYGGLAGRDLEATAVGLYEALQSEYQEYRHATIEYMLKKLIELDVPVVRPAGGHAVFLDAASFVSHISAKEFPGVALVNALYREGGIRSVELGSLMFGKYDKAGVLIPARRELVRLAFPRRVYTQSHFDYMIEVIASVWENRETLRGLRIVKEAPFLRHFSAWLEEL
ncbi:MAG: tryptophanase [Saprospiraceae bacterium]|nr:tryptophanase [Saprospiraceae bacterium]